MEMERFGMDKTKEIGISKKPVKESCIIIVFVHIAFMIMSNFPAVTDLKSKNLLSGLLLNWGYQLLLVALISFFMKDFLIESWRKFVSAGGKKNIKSILAGFFICFGLYFAFQIVIFAGAVNVGANQNQTMTREYLSAYPIAMAVLTVVVGTFTEECIYRGIIYQTLRKYNKVVANFGSSFLFGLMHVLSTIVKGNCEVGQVVILIMNYAIGGIGLALVQERYKNLGVNYFVHVLWNAIGTTPFVVLALVK